MSWIVHHGDCREILPTLGKVDAVVTDPPYGVAFRGEEWDREIPNWIEAARSKAAVVAFTTGQTTLWDYPRPDWVMCWQRPAAQSRTSFGKFSHWSPILVYGKGTWNPDCFKLHAMEAGVENAAIDHPSPKPVRLMRWLVRGAASPGSTILDPFCGSGSTGVAALAEGMNFIGIEREAKYVEIARRRIAAEAAQGKLEFT